MRSRVSVWALAAAVTIVVGVVSGCAADATTSSTGDHQSSAPSPIHEPVASPRGVATASGSPTATPPGSASAPTLAPETPAISTGPGPEEPRVIELELTSDLRIVQHGQQVTDIAVTPGETIRFVVTNIAGFDHDFYIGPDDRLAANRVEGLPGLDTWSSSEPRQFDWPVPEDVLDLKYGCTLRGHYPRMSGTFSIAD